ncbi:hypothetical protein KBD69_00345 [Candidatus Woesebacteria bacterium]|nr:hypothetical protein [Candidatus Woesebacteria bacterium]
MINYELYTHTQTPELVTYVLLPYTWTEDITTTSFVQARRVASALMCIDDLNSVSEGNGAGTALLNAIAVWGMSRGLDKITGSVVTRDGFYEALVKWYGKRGLSVQNGWLVGETSEVRDMTAEILHAHNVEYKIAT